MAVVFSQRDLNKEAVALGKLNKEPPDGPQTAVGFTARVSVATSTKTRQVNSVDVPEPPVNYVIIGYGPGAVMNHTTLRGSQWGVNRIGNLPVMHIGFRNPWPNYVQHGMGQVPFLLTMPGFRRQPNTPAPGQAIVRTLDGGLHSRDFGNAINEQYTYLRNNYFVLERRSWVAWIQLRTNPGAMPDIRDYYPENGPWQPGVPGAPVPPLPGGAAGPLMPNFLLNGPGTQLHAQICAEVNRGNQANNWPPGAHYRLVLVGRDGAGNLELDSVYAAYIDICTGPGRPNVINPPNATLTTKQVLHDARTPPWSPPEFWGPALLNRKVLNGVDAIAAQVVWAAGERVCVTAGGGVGLNAAEKARNNNAFLDWFARGKLINTFANPRNHTFLLSPGGGPMGVYELDTVEPFHQARFINFVPYPPVPRQRFGYDASLENAHLAPGNQVAVTLTGGGARLVDNAQGIAANAAALPPVVPPPPVPAGPLVPAAGLGLIPVPAAFVGPPPGNVWANGPAYIAGLDGGAHPNAANWPSPLYDRLVIPNGQGTNALGQPAKFTQINGQLAPVNLNGRGTVLATPNDRVRVLGAACQNHATFNIGGWAWAAPAPNPRWNHWHYHSTLPVSAVPDGFILSGSNIATANRYFNDHENTNINTMTSAEILAALPQALPNYPAGLLGMVAGLIIACRNRANGYPQYLDIPGAPIRRGLMWYVNNGQALLVPPVVPAAPPGAPAPAPGAPVPGAPAPGWPGPFINDAAHVGLIAQPGAPALTLADQVTFDAVFRYDYP